MEDLRTDEASSQVGGIAGAALDYPWLDIDQAAAYLRRSRRTIYKLCAQSKLAYYDAAGIRWFTKGDLDDYIASGRVEIFGNRTRKRRVA